MNSEQMRNVIGRTAKPLGAIATVAGFISDVLAPLGNIATWVAILSLLIFLGTAVAFWGMRKRAGMEAGESIMPAILVISAGATLIFSVWSIILANGPEKGFLADNIEPIARIQASLLNLEEDVAEIKETTAETAVQVEAIATTQTEIQETTGDTAENVETIATAQAQGFADIQAAFASLQAGQTLVDDPSTPQEWYSNARIYQLRGDTANAITAYEGYFTFGLEYVDPVLEYTNLLKATEGIARTRQIVSDMLNAQPNSKTLDMVLGALFDLPEERLPRLEALAQRAPDYAPVFYALGQEYTRGLRATYTQNLRDQQSEAFNMLFQLEEIQLYSSHFIDKSRAQEDLADAAVSLEEYANAGFLELDFISFYAHEGLTVIVIMPEANWQELRFGLDEPEPNHATDNPTIGPIPLEKGAHTLYIQYTDVNGADSAVYTFDYTIDDIVINYQQQPFDFSLDGIPVLFTMAVVGSNPDGVYNYNYSIDSEALDETVLGVGQAGVINFGPVEAGEHTLYVQAVGGDAETEIVEFPFTVEGE